MSPTTPLQADPAGFPVAAGLFAVALALVHLAAGSSAVADRWRGWPLSAAGGAAVAYVFVLLLPEVSEAAAIAGGLRGEAFLAEQLLYVTALAGFLAFYGVEVAVARRRGDVETAPPVFWVHVAVFAVYSALIGYLLFHQEVDGLANLAVYAVAMGLHFLVTDEGLARHHGDAFRGAGRWTLALGTLVGGVAGPLLDTTGLALVLVYGFVAGAIVFNVIKEELPDVAESRFGAFTGGALLYTVVVLLI